MVNAIQHGHNYNSNLKVHVRIAHIKDKQFKIIVKDRGNGFNYRNVGQSKLTDARRIWKRGYILIRKLAEHLEFNEKGNCVTVYTLNSVYL
ncbi:MAG: ATP-binding protein [Proteobacteria bacterium]|nr:ATP-binding protein [Pseudomonadota bacterium]